MCFLSSVKKDKLRLPLGHLWAELYPSFLALCHNIAVDLPSKIKLHRASSLWLGVFSFSPTCQNLSQLLLYLYWPLSFHCERLYRATLKPEINFPDVYSLPEAHLLVLS